MKKSVIFRIISIILIFTFLYQQLIWASDYSFGIPIENSENRSGFVTVNQLEESQKRQEELINRLQENLSWRIKNGYISEEAELQKKTSAGEVSVTASSGERLDL